MSIISLRKIVVLSIAAIATVLSCTVTYGDSSRRIGQTTVYAIPPAGFQEQAQFPGLVNIGLAASIVVIESDKATFPALIALFSDVRALNRQFALAHIQMNEIETIQSADGSPLKLAHGAQSTEMGEFERWMAVFQGGKAAIVTLQVKKPNKFDPAQVKAFFHSVRLLSPPSDEDILRFLSFNVEVLSPFHLSGNVGAAGIILLAGTDNLNSRNDEPFILIFHMPNIVKPQDRFAMAEEALRTTSTFKMAKVLSRRDVVFAGFEGVELDGETNAKGVTIAFRQWFTVDAGGRPFRMVAAGPKTKLQRLKPEIEKIVKSIALRPM